VSTATGLGTFDREIRYAHQNGQSRTLTGPQRRRSEKKSRARIAKHYRSRVPASKDQKALLGVQAAHEEDLRQNRLILRNLPIRPGVKLQMSQTGGVLYWDGMTETWEQMKGAALRMPGRNPKVVIQDELTRRWDDPEVAAADMREAVRVLGEGL